MPTPDADRSPKLYDVWGFVLLRGVIEGGLMLAFLFSALQEVGSLTLVITPVLIGGSLVELVMARRLRGHAFRSILIFVGIAGILISAFVLYNYFFVSGARVTLSLLVVMMGLWVAVRGFAALWLGLSIVAGTFERAVPVGAGLAGLVVGFAALTSFAPTEPTWFVRLLALYGLVSLAVHIAVALRMKRDRERVNGDEQRAPDGRAAAEQRVAGRDEQNAEA